MINDVWTPSAKVVSATLHACSCAVPVALTSDASRGSTYRIVAGGILVPSP